MTKTSTSQDADPQKKDAVCFTYRKCSECGIVSVSQKGVNEHECGKCECQQDTGNHIANLLCAETDQDNVKHSFPGEKCLEEFLKWVHSIANSKHV